MIWVSRLLALATLAPLVFWLGCMAFVMVLSGIFECTIHEGFANPCTVAGVDLSHTAYAAGVWAAWGLLILGPISMGAGILWAAVALGRRYFRKRT